jgi:AraC-like DNA-binding protein
MECEFADLKLLDDFTSLEVMRARYTTFRFPVHAHAEYMLGVVCQGTERFRYRGVDVNAPRGNLVFINPEESHTGEGSGDTWEYFALYPSISLIQRLLPTKTKQGTPTFRDATLRDHDAGRMFRSFVDAVFHKAAPLELQCRLVDLLSLLFGRYSDYSADEKRCSAKDTVLRIRQRLADAPEDTACLVQLAEQGGVSPLCLLRSFQQIVGCTPHVFQTCRRLQLVKSLIRSGEPLSEIALAAGFSDQSHLTNVFKRWIGITPGQYARSIMNKAA